MARALISLGSNIEPELNLRGAVRRLAERCKLLAVSAVYETDPVGTIDQARFLNAAALIETDLPAERLKTEVLRVIEQELGRVRTEDKNAPRTADLDLALYDNQVLDTGRLRVPDPDIERYAHVAVPLADLAPQMRHPVTGWTMEEMARALPAGGLRRRDDLALWPTRGDIVEIDYAGQVSALELSQEDDDALLAPTISPECEGLIECAVRDILEAIGEDPEREGLTGTPARVARMYAELTAGYHVDTEHLINQAIFAVSYDEMVIVRDIDFYSLCEHHMLPFIGQVHVAYIPRGKVIGLSKIPRVVEMFARRLQLQERMTQQIAEFLDQTLHPLGVAVVAQGLHMCAAMRGVKKSNARMVTSAMLGSFKTNQATRNEFFEHIARSQSD